MSSPPHTAAELLDVAVAAALEAGQMLVTSRPPGRPEVVRTKSSPTDVVTEMDRASERLIIDRIRAARPGDSFLGEEGGSVKAHEGGDSGSPVRWIIDPIDGTVNYLYGLPDWAVSIAAERSGHVVAGVVYVPERGELCTATHAGGAWLRSTTRDAAPLRLRCASGVPLAEALVATGFGYAAAMRAVQGEVVAALLPLVRDIRRGGSCAVDLCTVAAGRVDAYYERGINYWDRAAGGLIATEAGAQVGGPPGRPPGKDLTIAAGPGLFAELQQLLAVLEGGRQGMADSR